jgi:hypothetical protein
MLHYYRKLMQHVLASRRANAQYTRAHVLAQHCGGKTGNKKLEKPEITLSGRRCLVFLSAQVSNTTEHDFGRCSAAYWRRFRRHYTINNVFLQQTVGISTNMEPLVTIL